MNNGRTSPAIVPAKEIASRSKKPGGPPPPPHLPEHSKTRQRLTPKFTQLQNVFLQRTIEFQQSR